MSDGDDEISAMQILAGRIRSFGNQLAELKKDTSDLRKKVDRLIFESAEAKGAAKLRTRALATLGTLVILVTLGLQIYVATRSGK